MIKTPLLNQDSSATATVFEFGDDRDSVESDDGKRSFLKSASDEFDCRQFRTKEFKLDNQSERITVEKHKWEALEIQNRVLKSDLLQSTWHAKQLETKLASFEAKSLNESRWSSSMVNHFERLVLKSKDKQQTLKPTTINTKVDGTSQELNNIVIKLQNALSQSLQRVEELEQVVELQHAKLTNSHNRPEGDLGYNLCKSGIENNMARINEIIEPLATKSQIINELQQINYYLIECAFNGIMRDPIKVENLRSILLTLGISNVEQYIAHTIPIVYDFDYLKLLFQGLSDELKIKFNLYNVFNGIRQENFTPIFIIECENHVKEMYLICSTFAPFYNSTRFGVYNYAMPYAIGRFPANLFSMRGNE